MMERVGRAVLPSPAPLTHSLGPDRSRSPCYYWGFLNSLSVLAGDRRALIDPRAPPAHVRIRGEEESLIGGKSPSAER